MYIYNIFCLENDAENSVFNMNAQYIILNDRKLPMCRKWVVINFHC